MAAGFEGRWRRLTAQAVGRCAFAWVATAAGSVAKAGPGSVAAARPCSLWRGRRQWRAQSQTRDLARHGASRGGGSGGLSRKRETWLGMARVRGGGCRARCGNQMGHPSKAHLQPDDGGCLRHSCQHLVQELEAGQHLATHTQSRSRSRSRSRLWSWRGYGQGHGYTGACRPWRWPGCRLLSWRRAQQ
eukprot:350657-Chlamydomonas_euryale.AAC.1